MKYFRSAVLSLAALIVAACLPVTTKNPVGTTVGFKPDSALIGLWKTHGNDPDDKDGYIVFLADEDGSITALAFSTDTTSGEWESYTLKTADLGSLHLINVWSGLKNGKPVDAPEAEADIVMSYRMEPGGKLTLSLLDDKATAAAIKAGRIAGTVDPGDFGDVRITAEPAALDAFFAGQQGAALFSQKLVTLTKVE